MIRIWESIGFRFGLSSYSIGGNMKFIVGTLKR